jgi:hypothetical protein
MESKKDQAFPIRFGREVFVRDAHQNEPRVPEIPDDYRATAPALEQPPNQLISCLSALKTPSDAR